MTPVLTQLDAFFFPTSDDLQLFGVARGPRDAACVWILCPPFAEEEKSSRRLFTLIAKHLEARGQGSLIFSFRGTSDSQGNFARADLSAWKRDLQAARDEAKQRFPDAKPALLGVRLGASLAWQEAQNLGADRLILIEPLLSGRSFLLQQTAKRQIRAQLTGETTAVQNPVPNVEDLDGWELGQTLKSELKALDLKRETPAFPGAIALFQVGPKSEIAPPLEALATQVRARTRAVVMPPFWNLIDAPDFAPLLRAIAGEIEHE